MTKLFAIATILILAISTSVTTAQAGMRVGFGIGVGTLALGAIANAHRHHEAQEYRAHRKARTVYRDREKSPVRAAKKSASKPQQQLAEIEAAPVSSEASGIASSDTETTPSITTGSLKSTETKAKTASLTTEHANPESDGDAGHGMDCKKFFPSVGMTLSVPCE